MSNQWKWSDFNPKIVKIDKRDRENAVEKNIKLVMKNFNELGLSSLASVPVIDRNRTVQKVIHVYHPNSLLTSFFSNANNRQYLYHFLSPSWISIFLGKLHSIPLPFIFSWKKRLKRDKALSVLQAGLAKAIGNPERMKSKCRKKWIALWQIQ